jgi:hypothetical protein
MNMVRIQDAAGILGVTDVTLRNHFDKLYVKRHKSVTLLGVRSLVSLAQQNGWLSDDELVGVQKVLLNRAFLDDDSWAFISDAATQAGVSRAYIYTRIQDGSVRVRGRKPKQINLDDLKRVTTSVQGKCVRCGRRFRYSIARGLWPL